MAAGGVGLIVLPAELAVGGSGHLVGECAHTESKFLLESIALCEDVVAYLLSLGSDIGIDLAKAVLLLLGQADTLTLEAFIVLFEHHLLLAGKAALVTVPNGGDALVEGLVEGYVGLVLAHQRDGLFDNGIKGIAAVGLGNVVEHSADLGEDAPGILQRGDGILKTGGLLAGDYGIDFGLLLGYAGLDCRDVVGGLYLIEGRNSIRGVPLREEGVGAVASHKRKGERYKGEYTFHLLVNLY